MIIIHIIFNKGNGIIRQYLIMENNQYYCSIIYIIKTCTNYCMFPMLSKNIHMFQLIICMDSDHIHQQDVLSKIATKCRILTQLR